MRVNKVRKRMENRATTCKSKCLFMFLLLLVLLLLSLLLFGVDLSLEQQHQTNAHPILSMHASLYSLSLSDFLSASLSVCGALNERK